jgi:hypothetical protein
VLPFKASAAASSHLVSTIVSKDILYTVDSQPTSGRKRQRAFNMGLTDEMIDDIHIDRR